MSDSSHRTVHTDLKKEVLKITTLIDFKPFILISIAAQVNQDYFSS